MFLVFELIRLVADGNCDAALVADAHQGCDVVGLKVLLQALLHRRVPACELLERGKEVHASDGEGDQELVAAHIGHLALLLLDTDFVPLHQPPAPQGPRKELRDVVAPRVQDLLEGAGSRRARDDAGPHVHRVVLVEVGVLAEPLHVARDGPRDADLLQALVFREVHDDGAVGAAVDLKVRILGALQAPAEVHLIVRGLDGVPTYDGLAGGLVLLQLLLAHRLECFLDRLHVLAKLLTEDLEVQRGDDLHVVGVLLVEHIHHSQLLLHILLECLDVLYERLVLVDDCDALQRHPRAHLLPLAARAPELHDRLHALHRPHDVRVEHLGVRLGDHHEVHGRGLQRVPVGQCLGEVLVEELCDEGRYGSQQHRDIHQNLVQCAEAQDRLIGPAVALHPLAVQPDVPVRQVLEHQHQAGDHRVESVRLHLLAHELDEALAAGRDPLVHEVLARLHHGAVRRELLARVLVAVALLDEEGVRVVPRQEDILHDAPHALLLEFEGLSTDNRRVAHVHADRVGAVALDYLLRVGVVLQPLAHLLTVRGQDETVDNEVLEGRLIEQVR
mmetsp:Transcript_72030/g.203460  ORF Transcript_72030/g.203460 Transcript_72030/m.203460 type:complete len:559 (-) Transcript_72030:1935-3611(-)